MVSCLLSNFSNSLSFTLFFSLDNPLVFGTTGAAITGSIVVKDFRKRFPVGIMLLRSCSGSFLLADRAFVCFGFERPSISWSSLTGAIIAASSTDVSTFPRIKF